MEKYINPDSDGKFYKSCDMAKLSCMECAGCCSCCVDMGDSIRLDPYDLYQLAKGTDHTFTELMATERIALTIDRGVVVPYIKMNAYNQCSYLNEEKRCKIHEIRPGMCRLFPLGRDYQDGELSYILLSELCEKKNRTKEKIDRFIGVQPFAKYEAYIVQWHDFRQKLRGLLEGASEEEAAQLNHMIAQVFYAMPYDTNADFYAQFEMRRKKFDVLF